MVLRWTAAAILEAVKGFRRLKGHKDMPRLVAALRARDQQLGIGVSVENVAENVNRAAAEFQQPPGHPLRSGFGVNASGVALKNLFPPTKLSLPQRRYAP